MSPIIEIWAQDSSVKGLRMIRFERIAEGRYQGWLRWLGPVGEQIYVAFSLTLLSPQGEITIRVMPSSCRMTEAIMNDLKTRRLADDFEDHLIKNRQGGSVQTFQREKGISSERMQDVIDRGSRGSLKSLVFHEIAS